jgi:predicted dithiol-disulfide oxidoreductase (DUF899 family)
MGLRFPNESPEYRAARDRLLAQEIELRRMAESVARARRALPPGGLVGEDYVFDGLGADGKPGKLRLTQLFGDRPTLAIYSYMFGPEKERPCPMCTPLLDGLDGVGEHLRQRLAFAVVAESPFERLRAWQRERGWRHLRLLSTAGNRYNRDYHGKDGGEDTTMLNVFRKDGDRIRHFWGSELTHGPSDPGQDHRGVDVINPIFAMFDLTPEGRGEHYTKLEYP